ncbi:hypothetical protein ABZV68_33905, partial [Streptomyces clavifer]
MTALPRGETPEPAAENDEDRGPGAVAADTPGEDRAPGEDGGEDADRAPVTAEDGPAAGEGAPTTAEDPAEGAADTAGDGAAATDAPAALSEAEAELAAQRELHERIEKRKAGKEGPIPAGTKLSGPAADLLALGGHAGPGALDEGELGHVRHRCRPETLQVAADQDA